MRTISPTATARKLSGCGESTIPVVPVSGKVTYNGFPFFPGQQRELRLPWREHETPTQVVLRFRESKVTHPLADADARHTTSRQ